MLGSEHVASQTGVWQARRDQWRAGNEGVQLWERKKTRDTESNKSKFGLSLAMRKKASQSQLVLFLTLARPTSYPAHFPTLAAHPLLKPLHELHGGDGSARALGSSAARIKPAAALQAQRRR